MKLQYYAWLRDSMGCDAEHIVLPNEVKSVGMLLDWLPTQDDRFKMTFVYIDVLLVSVNLCYADRDYPVHDEDEVILSPPIAGG